jgi:hypothetical protein
MAVGGKGRWEEARLVSLGDCTWRLQVTYDDDRQQKREAPRSQYYCKAKRHGSRNEGLIGKPGGRAASC